MGSGTSGKGSSSAETTQQVENNQVATESGLAFGRNATGNEVNITTDNPEIVKAAIAGNAYVSDKALGFAGASAAIAADVNKFAVGAVENLAGTSVLAQNALATKFGQNVSDLAAQNINLLQSVNQEQTDVALRALGVSNDALDKSFAVSRAVAPQDANFTQSDLAATTGKTILYLVLGPRLSSLFARLGTPWFPFLRHGETPVFSTPFPLARIRANIKRKPKNGYSSCKH